MNNIIWTKEELKNIKKIILNKCNLKLNDNNEIETFTTDNDFYHPNVSLFSIIKEEFEELFYINSKNKISEILTKASQINVDLNNKMHIGFISNISKVNPTRCEEIFIIFREIIALYERIINTYANSIIKECENPDKALELFKEITNNETEYETIIKTDIYQIFSLANGIVEYDLFKPLINKLNSLIKPRLIVKMKDVINNIIKTEDAQKKNYTREYKANFYTRYQREQLEQVKSKKLKVFNI